MKDHKYFKKEQRKLSKALIHVAAPHLPRIMTTYDLRSADITADQNAILRVCKVSSLNCTSAKYCWNYAKNPVLGTWCQVAVDSATKRIVGTAALFSRRLLVNGMHLRAAVAGDFAVDPKHRMLYPAIALQRAAVAECTEGNFDVLYAFPNDASRPIQIRAGFKVVGSLQSGVRILRSGALLKQYGHNGWWTRTAGILDWAVTLASRESRISLSRDYLFCRLDAFDKRFDHFWDRMLWKYPTVVERTSSYANWRFMECPSKKYSLLAAVHRRTGEIGGYVVFWSQSGKTRISDIMAFDDVFDELLAALIDSERRNGSYCLTIVYLGGNSLVHRLQRFGFLFRQTSSQLLAHVNPKIPELRRLFGASSWYLLDGDSDC